MHKFSIDAGKLAAIKSAMKIFSMKVLFSMYFFSIKIFSIKKVFSMKQADMKQANMKIILLECTYRYDMRVTCSQLIRFTEIFIK